MSPAGARIWIFCACRTVVEVQATGAVEFLQLLGHESQLTVLPSSQSSPVSLMPLPQTGPPLGVAVALGTGVAVVVAVGVAVVLVLHPDRMYLFPAILAIPLLFGVMMIIPIGGADMPTVIAILNSYAGLSACR